MFHGIFPNITLRNIILIRLRKILGKIPLELFSVVKDQDIAYLERTTCGLYAQINTVHLAGLRKRK
jgi:hypothetical protein